MCVAAIAWQAHPRWRLVAIGNRDEFHERPAAPLQRWQSEPGVMAGRDLRSGGTWLGVSDAGRFVLVTNRRGYGLPVAGRASRGTLVTDLLAGSGRYRDPRGAQLDDFNPFNLVTAANGRLRYLANRPEPTSTALASGLYGLSNGALDEPWPKTLYLKAALLDWLNTGDTSTDVLFAALASESSPAIGIAPGEPSEISAEALETAPFIRNRLYGTRCSTVVAIDSDGAGSIGERRFDDSGKETGRNTMEFRWPV